MATDVIVFGWNRSIPGREKLSAAHFTEFVNYLGALRSAGAIESFDIVLLDSHGGDLNGFFLLKGDGEKLRGLVSTRDWLSHMARASLHLDRAGAIHGVTGDEIAKRMALWQSAIPA